MIHTLKTWPEFFQAVRRGEKTGELRKNDRDFRVGDFLILQEWDPRTSTYTDSKPLKVRISHVLSGGFGLREGYALLSFAPLDLPIRSGVRAFAKAMEAKLRKHDSVRGEGWRNESVEWLFERLSEEKNELRQALRVRDYAEIASEAADVGNFAMMVAEVSGASTQLDLLGDRFEDFGSCMECGKFRLLEGELCPECNEEIESPKG